MKNVLLYMKRATVYNSWYCFRDINWLLVFFQNNLYLKITFFFPLIKYLLILHLCKYLTYSNNCDILLRHLQLQVYIFSCFVYYCLMCLIICLFAFTSLLMHFMLLVVLLWSVSNVLLGKKENCQKLVPPHLKIHSTKLKFITKVSEVLVSTTSEE